VRVTPWDLENGWIEISNRYDFSTLEHLQGTWELLLDGEVLQSGQLPVLHTAPGASEKIQIPFDMHDPDRAGEIWLMLRLALTEDASWAKTGHQVAWEQLKLPFPSHIHSDFHPDVSPLSVQETAEKIQVGSADFIMDFDRATGMLARYDWKGTSLLHTGPSLNAWRAATDNDGFKWNPGDPLKLLYHWLEFGLNRLQHRLDRFELEQSKPEQVHIMSCITSQADGVDGGFIQEMNYRVHGSTGLEIDLDVKCFGDLPPLPRLGLTLSLPEGFENFAWLGRGPEESYNDRKAGVPVGLHRSTVAEQFVPYVMPQEHGNKTDVRWAALSNAQGKGLLVLAEPLMNVSASHFRDDDLYQAMHTNELSPRPEVILDLDIAQCGLGGNSCGPATLDQYMVWPGEFHLRLLFRPFGPNDSLRRLGQEWIGS
jgi:hypothetical protein